MARTNYSFEKRQRELAKKRKKEEKAAKKASGGDDGAEMTPNDAAMLDLPTDNADAVVQTEQDAADDDAAKSG